METPHKYFAKLFQGWFIVVKLNCKSMHDSTKAGSAAKEILYLQNFIKETKRKRF